MHEANLEQLFMKQNQFNKLELMMLADSHRNLIFEDELMVDDNFDMPLSQADREKYMTPAYPFKLMFMMIMICTKGYMRFRCNLQERRVEAGDVVILFPNSIGECLESSLDFQVAFIACLDDSYAGEANASFSAKFRSRLAQQMIISLTRERMGEMLFLYHLMRKKMAAPHAEFTREALKGCMQVILADCYQELAKEQELKDTKERRNRSKHLFDTFLGLVQRHYTQERSITFYADAMCLTSKYLAQVVYQESGRHAGEWIKDCVILEAKALLKSGKYTAQQVSDMLNFANASFFGKYFKAAVGCSPKQYQKK